MGVAGDGAGHAAASVDDDVPGNKSGAEHLFSRVGRVETGDFEGDRGRARQGAKSISGGAREAGRAASLDVGSGGGRMIVVPVF